MTVSYTHLDVYKRQPVIEPRHILCVGENQLIVGSVFYRLVEQQTHFFGVCIAPVSYTHLDVYKRQV